MKRTKIFAALTALLLLCGMTACAPQPEPAPPEEDVIVAITAPPTTEPHTTRPPTEAHTETTEDLLEKMYSAGPGEAYLAIVDSAWFIKYLGNSAQTDVDDTGWFLSYDAGIVNITGNGTYTVSVNADTKGFRLASTENIEGENIPHGLSYMAVVIRDGADFMPDALITIDKIKVDGREIELTGRSFTTTGEDKGTGQPAVLSVICDPLTEELPKDARCEDGDVEELDDKDDFSMQLVDPEDFEDWQKVEVTFTVSGLEDSEDVTSDETETTDEDETETTEDEE